MATMLRAMCLPNSGPIVFAILFRRGARGGASKGILKGFGDGQATGALDTLHLNCGASFFINFDDDMSFWHCRISDGAEALSLRLV